MRIQTIPYGEALKLQKQALEKLISEEGEEVLFVMTHPPTITIGRKGNPMNIKVPIHLLKERGIEVFRVERGGDVTFHAPGQIVAYPIINLTRHKISPKEHVSNLEETMIKTLETFSIPAFRIQNFRGVFVKGNPPHKIGAVGVAISHGISFHGLALNVSINPSEFEVIIPCGLKDYPVASMESYTYKSFQIEEVADVLISQFKGIYGNSLIIGP